MNQIVLEIFKWYSLNRRNLPWRKTRNPYKIWLSEIILQQTQVKQGLDYYENFITTYPTVKDLASAKEEKIMKSWQGLGYYNRARNLHRTAKIVDSELNGIFPETHSGLLNLPGIGEYTAAAIASFAYDKKHPVLDGNVFRFISRLFGIDLPIDIQKNKQVFYKILNEMMDTHSPSVFNNAMMEMGAVICKPVNPLCSSCPVSQFCFALKEDKITLLPVKGKKVALKTRYFNFIHVDFSDGFYLEKRTKKDIWQNLFQLPLLETTGKSDKESIRNQLQTILTTNGEFEIVHKKYFKHVLTHQLLHCDFWYIRLNEAPVFQNKNIILTTLDNYKKYALPKLIDKYLLLLQD